MIYCNLTGQNGLFGRNKGGGEGGRAFHGSDEYTAHFKECVSGPRYAAFYFLYVGFEQGYLTEFWASYGQPFRQINPEKYEYVTGLLAKPGNAAKAAFICRIFLGKQKSAYSNGSIYMIVISICHSACISK